nr:MAG TPA: large terminase [Caudoviricetes sp.]
MLIIPLILQNGAVRAGKTVDNVYAFAHELKTTPDKIHLATGSTSANAKLNIGDANGFGLEYIFRGQSHWGKFKGNECLYIKGPDTNYRQKIVIFAGAAKEDSYKKIRGNSYGMWIGTEINLHHDNTIKEAFNRQLAAKRRKIFWDLNPDNPNADIYTKYIDLYAKKHKDGTLLGGYNYQHFTIFDNVNIPDLRKQEIISQYDQNSIWYLRDILGKRCIAEGLCYRKFANKPIAYRISREEAKQKISQIIIGVDFGGSGSGHAFVATGISRDYRDVIGLASERHFGDIDPNKLGDLFVDFVLKVINLYGMPDICYADSAEQTLIRGLRTSIMNKNISLIIDNAWKSEINERIRATNRLMGQMRIYLTDDCESLETAFCTAVWNPKILTKDERLDDGTSDIDSLDAFEYTIERSIELLILTEV